MKWVMNLLRLDQACCWCWFWSWKCEPASTLQHSPAHPTTQSHPHLVQTTTPICPCHPQLHPHHPPSLLTSVFAAVIFCFPFHFFSPLPSACPSFRFGVPHFMAIPTFNVFLWLLQITTTLCRCPSYKGCIMLIPSRFWVLNGLAVCFIRNSVD